MQEYNNKDFELMEEIINRIKDTQVFNKDNENEICSALKLKINEGKDIQEDVAQLHKVIGFILKRKALGLNNSISIWFNYNEEMHIMIDLDSTSGELKIPKNFKNVKIRENSYIGLPTFSNGDNLKKMVDCTIYIDNIKQLNDTSYIHTSIQRFIPLLAYKYVVIKHTPEYLEYLINVIKLLYRNNGITSCIHSNNWKYILKLISDIKDINVDINFYNEKIEKYRRSMSDSNTKMESQDYLFRMTMLTNNLIKGLEDSLEKMYENN